MTWRLLLPAPCCQGRCQGRRSCRRATLLGLLARQLPPPAHLHTDRGPAGRITSQAAVPGMAVRGECRGARVGWPQTRLFRPLMP